MGLLALSVPRTIPAQVPYTFPTTDGTEVYAYYYTQQAAPHSRALIVAFHQGGANAKGEYGPIVPRLLDQGFDVLAVDLRSGGTLFGETNATVASRSGSAPYCAAEPDVEGAIMLATRIEARPIVLWGSSYSAALVLRAAARHARQVRAVLAFSPATGPPMRGCLPETAAGGVTVPTLVLASEAEVEGPLAASFSRYRAQGHETFMASPGIHGASMLVPGRAGESAEVTWKVVEAFLDRTAPGSVP